MLARAAAVVMIVGSQGCHRDFSNGDANVMPIVDASDGRTLVAKVPVTINRDVDILFVIDDSPGTLDKQTNLKNNFPNFINVLNTIEGGLPNVHLGVVSTDLGTKGTQDPTAGPGIGSGPGSCSGSGKNGNLQTNGTTLVSNNFILDIKNTDGTRTTNYTGTLSAAFSAIASLGASGCGFEQPLEAARRALNNNAANTGFLRPSAQLAVVLFTDEDDCSFAHSTLLGSDTSSLGPLQSFRCTRFGVTCSGGGATPDEMNTPGSKTGCRSNEASQYLEPVGTYTSFFLGLKADPRNVYVGAISGPATPVSVELRTPPGGGTAIPAVASSCSYSGGNGSEVADPGVRVAQLANSIGNHSLSTICQQDLSQALTDTARKIKFMIGDPCIDATLPLTGLDCIVTQESGGASTMLPACTAGAPPCWEIVTDNQNCASASHQKLNIQRTQAPPPDTVVEMRCRL